MLFILIACSFLSSTLGDPYSCHNENFVLDADNSPFSVNKTIMDSEQNCMWNFTMPDNFMAEITINGTSMTFGDQVQVYSIWTNSSQYMVLRESSTNNLTDGYIHTMWPPTMFQMNIVTAKNTTMMLAIDIVLKPLSVSDKVKTLLSTSANQQPNYVQFMDWKVDTAILAQADNNGKLNIAIGSPTWSNSYANIFVYDGLVDNLQFRGTIQSLVWSATDWPYTSSMDTLTFYRAMDDGMTATLIVNDYENTKNLTYFQVDWSPYNRPTINYQQSYLLDASRGLAALTVLNDADGSNAIYLEKVEYMVCLEPRQCPNIVNYTSPVKLLSGGMIRDYDTQGTLLGTYRDVDDFDDRNYPQFLPGMARTFVLEEGMAIISYTSMAMNTKDSDALNGRNGFVMSNNYPFKAVDQNSQDFSLNSVDGKMFTFVYTINQANPNEGAYLNFSIKGENNRIVDLHNIMAPASFNITAMRMTMTIFGGNEPSMGTYISYKISSTAEPPAVTTTMKTNPMTTTMPTTPTMPSSTPAAQTTTRTTVSSQQPAMTTMEPTMSTMATMMTMNPTGTTGMLATTGQPDMMISTDAPAMTTTNMMTDMPTTTATGNITTTTPKASYLNSGWTTTALSILLLLLR